jgi:hypothetical protein
MDLVKDHQVIEYGRNLGFSEGGIKRIISILENDVPIVWANLTRTPQDAGDYHWVDLYNRLKNSPTQVYILGFDNKTLKFHNLCRGLTQLNGAGVLTWMEFVVENYKPKVVHHQVALHSAVLVLSRLHFENKNIDVVVRSIDRRQRQSSWTGYLNDAVHEAIYLSWIWSEHIPH